MEFLAFFSELLIDNKKHKILYLLENVEKYSECEIYEKIKIDRKKCKKILGKLEKEESIISEFENRVIAENFPKGEIIWYYSISPKGISTLQRIKKIKITILLVCLYYAGHEFLNFILKKAG